MNQSELEDLIRRSLDEFYQRRIKKLSELKLQDVLRKKNPYLLRAIGVEKASEIVEEILKAFMSSSDESIFGDAFFEPIVRHCYGRKSTNSSSRSKLAYRSLAGQAFWEELTGEPDFYVKLIELMRSYPQQHRLLFKKE
jgi:hypothetical protein